MSPPTVSTTQVQEYVVRIPRETKKRFHVMRFNSSLNVNIADWCKTTCKLERENNQKESKTEEFPKFGAGSEFGKQQKEEARKKKFGFQSKKYNPNDQPWMLKVGSGKHAKRYKGVREGGVAENVSYYVFFQALDGVFESFPVDEWYNFAPINRYKALTAEEAEEKFAERNKIYNFFSVMGNRKDAESGENETKVKAEKKFKITDMDDWNDSGESGGEREDDEVDTKQKAKAKSGKTTKKPKKKKKTEDSDDSEPQEDSDEGDYDDVELDYISDSSSSSESETEKKDELKGVEDEDALRKLVLSDDEEEETKDESEKSEDKSSTKTEAEADGKAKVKVEKESNFDSPPPSSSDSDDSDLDESKSALFMQKKNIFKPKNGTESAPASRSLTPTPSNDSSSQPGSSKTDSIKLKRRNSPSEAPSAKKPKLVQDLNSDGINEEAVRRYLMRKPMTTKDLLQKFKNKVNSKDELLNSIAPILKRLNPEKQTIKGKMYLFLKA